MGTLGTLQTSLLMSRLMMIGIGLLSFVGQILLTLSLQLEEAGKVSIMRKAGDILFAFLFQIFIFQDYPGVWSIVGAILVSVAVFINGSNKVVDNLPDDHIVKTKYLRPCYGDPPGGDDEEATDNEQLHNDEQLHRDEQLHNNEHAGNKKHNASEAETTGNEENPAKS